MRLLPTLPILAAAAAMALPFPAAAQTASQPTRTVAPIRPVTDTYWGQTVKDNYRWLEDQSSPESKAWMRSQADYTRTVLDSLPGRAAFAAEMTKFLNAPEYVISDVQTAGSAVFYRKRLRGENQASLYVRPAGGGAEHRVFDLSALSKPGAHISLDQYAPSRNGKLVLVGLSAGGSEEQTGHIYDAATGRELSDTLERFEGGGFAADGKSVYFLQLEAHGPDWKPIDKYRRPHEFQHVLGQPTSADTVVIGQGVAAEVPVPDYNFPSAFPSPDAPYALANIAPGVDAYQTIYIGAPAALTTHKGWTPVAVHDDKVTDSAIMGKDLYLVSFRSALNGQLLRLDAAHPEIAKATVVPLPPGFVLSGGFIGQNVLHAAKDALYVQGLDRGYSKVYRVHYGAEPAPVLLTVPAGMSVGATATATNVPGAILDLSGWTTPGDFYSYRPGATELVNLHLEPESSIDPKDLTFEEVEVKAADGVMVPLSLIYRKGMAKSASTPTALIGYGAYGDAFTPGFSRRNMAWLERGGLLAVAHVRGGGELGESWHLAGKGLTKHNTWEDFIASAEYLIGHGYTSAAKIGIWSQSAGGILIGRSVTARPDLFAAAVDGVPCSDMVREETGPNGPANTPEFGTVKNEDGFKALYAMSAYEHVVPGTKYPAVLVTAGANDPRVDPWQGGKMAAALEAATTSDKPILLRVNYDAGHGLTDTVAQQVSDWTDIFTFFLWNFGAPQFQPPASVYVAPAVKAGS